MRITRTLRLTASAALSSVVATIAFAGPLAGSALAAPGKPQPTPMPTLTQHPDNPTKATSATFAWTAPVTETYSCTIDGRSTNGCLSPVTYSGLANGSHTFSLRAKLPAPTKSKASTVNFSWVIDNTPPQAPTVQAVTPNPTKNTVATVFFSDADPSAVSFTCALDNSDPTAATACTTASSFSVSGLSETTHTAYVYAFDSLGNRSNAGTTAWTVDLTAPGSPVFTQVPNNPTAATTATFAWSDGDATSFLCSVDGGTPATCSSGVSFPNLGEGSHSISVQGRDGAGNVGLPTTYGWRIDLTAPPAPTFVTGPATPTDQPAASFVFTDSEAGVAFKCKLDSGSFGDCTSPQDFASLLDGDHEFDVEAVDAVGNTSPATPYQWHIDTTGTVALSPVVMLTGPDAFTNDSHPAFTWAALDSTATDFQCSLDLAPFTACGQPDSLGNGGTSLVVTGNGLHTLAVRETDGTNTSSAATWQWRYDAIPPTAPTFSAAPGSIDPSPNALFSFASDPDTHFTCSLDGATATLCASPASFSGLSDGGHTFVVTAIDPAGNSTSTEYDWTIDTSAPIAPVLTGPATPFVNTDQANVSWSETDPSVTSESCTLNGADYTPCASPETISGLEDGTYAFQVTASDGTHIAKSNVVTWTVDTTKPVLDVTGVPTTSLDNSTTVTPVVSQGAEANPGANVCQLTGPSGTVNNCGPYTLDDGDYTLTVDSTDLAGNAADQATFSWTTDATSPVVDVTGLPGDGDFVNSGSFAPVVSDDDAHSSDTYTCSLSGPVTSSSCSDLSGLTDGNYTFTAGTTDLAGNSSTAYTRSWTVDLTKPVLSVTGLPADGAFVNTTSFAPVVSDDDANSSGVYTCSLTGPTTSSSCSTLSGLADGSYTFTADTTDKATNAADQLSLSWTVDTVKPATPGVSGPTGTVNSTTATFTLSDTDSDVTSYRCSLDGATATACPGSYPGLSDGAHTLDVTARDAAGNTSDATHVSWVVDTGAPVASIVAPSTLTGAGKVTFGEPVSGLDVTKVTLKETDSGATVPAKVVCNAVCTGTVSSLTVTPTRRLVPGQHYTLAVAAGAAQDVAGNGLTAAAKLFRAQRTLQENTPPVAVTWRSVKASPAFGHRYATEHLAGAQATWAFRGRAITWWTVTGPTQGKARVFVDGKRKATVNNYASATHYRVARTFKKLGAGRHVLTIRVLGVKGRTIGKGTAVAIDGFTVGKKRTASPRLTTSWHRVAGSAFYGRHAVVADLAGEAISLTFRGTSIAWTTVRNKTQGKAAVFVDGVRKATVDNYSKLSLTKVRRLVRGLSDSVHTVRIVVLGKHHKGGKGNRVTVDRFVIG